MVFIRGKNTKPFALANMALRVHVEHDNKCHCYISGAFQLINYSTVREINHKKLFLLLLIFLCNTGIKQGNVFILLIFELWIDGL